jgi:putative transposase
MGWKRTSHSVYDCKYHLIWCPKRRKKLEGDDIRQYVKETIRDIAEELGFEIVEMEIGKDHVHIFISFPPRYSISKVVGIMKSISASRVFDRYDWMKKKFWSGELWEDGYCVRTVGDKVTAEIVKRYIRRHEEEATNQMKFF